MAALCTVSVEVLLIFIPAPPGFNVLVALLLVQRFIMFKGVCFCSKTTWTPVCGCVCVVVDTSPEGRDKTIDFAFGVSALQGS